MRLNYHDDIGVNKNRPKSTQIDILVKEKLKKIIVEGEMTDSEKLKGKQAKLRNNKEIVLQNALNDDKSTELNGKKRIKDMSVEEKRRYDREKYKERQ